MEAQAQEATGAQIIRPSRRNVTPVVTKDLIGYGILDDASHDVPPNSASAQWRELRTDPQRLSGFRCSTKTTTIR